MPKSTQMLTPDTCQFERTVAQLHIEMHTLEKPERVEWNV